MVSRCAAMEQTGSRQIAWGEVSEFLVWAARRYSITMWDWPLAGTPAWAELDNADPRKLLSALAGTVYWAFDADARQAAMAAASREISAMEDWRAISQEIQSLQEFRTAHPWAKRAAS